MLVSKPVDLRVGRPVEELLSLIVLLLVVAAFGLGCLLEKRARASRVPHVNKPPVGERTAENGLTHPDA